MSTGGPEANAAPVPAEATARSASGPPATLRTPASGLGQFKLADAVGNRGGLHRLGVRFACLTDQENDPESGLQYFGEPSLTVLDASAMAALEVIIEDASQRAPRSAHMDLLFVAGLRGFLVRSEIASVGRSQSKRTKRSMFLECSSKTKHTLKIFDCY